MPPHLIGDWCIVADPINDYFTAGTNAARQGVYTHQYRRRLCADNDGQFHVSRNGYREVESACVLIRRLPVHSSFTAEFRCGGDDSIWEETAAFSVNSGTGRLTVMTSEPRGERNE